MTLDGIKAYVSQDWERVAKLIQDSLGSDIDTLNSINSSILSRSGKQLRPLISILVARACSGGCLTEASYRFAAATELLHNATLLHDDVADSSEERHGAPTLVSMLDPSVSVLVGDFWLVKAVQLVLGDSNDDVNYKVTKLFSKTLSDLAEGEMFQLQKADIGDTTEDDYKRIIYCKTASLFETAALSAAVSVGADSQTLDAVRGYAVSVGMAFQVRDDIFDYQPPSPAIGKPVGVDICERKITMPLFGAFLNAGAEKEAEIRRKITQIDAHPKYKDEIISFARTNGGIEYADQSLLHYETAAVQYIKLLPEGYDRDCLEAIAKFLTHRQS